MNACEHKPGWFKFGEPEKAAALLSLNLEDFFKKYISVDWWEASPDVFLLAPATSRSEPGSEYPGNPTGRCIFLENGLCKIHAAKPYECLMELHGDPPKETQAHKADAMKTWDNEAAQQQVEQLLGHEPISSEYSMFDALSWGL